MAGIEKICEFSGEYPEPGNLMYGWKKNLIQVMPHHRKLFRGTPDAELVIEGYEIVLIRNSRICGYVKTTPYAWDLEGWQDYKGNPVVLTPEQYLELKREQGWYLCVEWQYSLRVKNEALNGDVNGRYMNWSRDLSTVRRKLNRLVGYRLPVVWECERPTFKQRKREWAK